MRTSQFNTGPWTEEEHQNFLRGVEVHGRGNWNVIGTIVRTRNPQQIEAHARQHFAQRAEEQGLEPAEANTAVSSVVAVAGRTAATPDLALVSGTCCFGDGKIIFDYTGVL